jgi:hypothetical protein
MNAEYDVEYRSLAAIFIDWACLQAAHAPKQLVAVICQLMWVN